jgi:iron complex transport system substrate-binding protein
MPVKRVIALTPDSAEAIVAIDSGNKLVGISNDFASASMKSTFPVVSKLPTIGGSLDPDCEAAISLNPDVIITYGKSPDADKLEKKLENTNITVVRLDCWKPEYIAEDVKKLGYLLGKKTNADELVNFQTKYLELIRDRLKTVPDDKRPRVYLEGYGDYSTFSKGWGIHWYCLLAGGKNIAADLPGASPKIDSEWVLKQNPEVIVKVTSSDVAGYGVDDQSKIKALSQAVSGRAGWSNITAVKSERVYIMSRDKCYGTDYILGLTYLAKCLHPDLFEDLDPEEIHQEYINRFPHLDYDLDKHGVFIYPPIEKRSTTTP